MPSPSPSPGAQLTGVSAASATDIWAVGFIAAGASGPDRPLIVHWDGTSWTQRAITSPNGNQFLRLEAVTATSASDVWAVGEYTPTGGQSSAEQTLILHWDGTSWTQKPSPSPDDSSELVSVWARSATDAWAVGSSNQGFAPLIERWNGTSWTRASTVPVPPGSTASLSSVSALSATDAWAVGTSRDNATFATAPLIEHWNGSTWTRRISPSPGGIQGLKDVRGISATNAWAVGTSGASAAPLVVHWDGTVWSQTVAPAGLDGIAALGTSAAGDVWVAGNSRFAGENAAEPLPQAQIAVNANSTLAESGFVNRSVASANLAPGTNPGVALQPDGSSLVAWVSSSGLLWTMDAAGNKVNTQHQVAAGTSPVVTTLAGGGFAVVFVDAAGNVLRMLGPNGSANALGNGPAVAAGTSPAIAGDGNGAFEAAYHAAGTDHLVTVTQAGAVHDAGAAIAAGASPAVTRVANGLFYVVFPAASGALSWLIPDGHVQQLGSGPAVAAGTSPAVAIDPHDLLQAVYQAAGTGELWTAGTASAAPGTGVQAAAGTSPAIAGLVSGGFEIAYQATAGRELFTLAGGQARDAGIAMGVHDSPAMAVLPPPIAARTAVPGVTGQTDGAARTAITGAGLTVGTITADNSCQVDPGIVTGQSPAAGISARLGDPVSLSESSGKTPQGGPCHPVLPSLFGFDDKTAQNTITGLGLVVGQVTTGSNCAVSKGDVFSQNPGPGPVAPGTVVSLAESNGLDQHNKPCNIQ